MRNRIKLNRAFSYKVVNRFFDRDVVIRHMDRKKLRGMTKIGAYIRRKGRNKTRFSKRTSRPGEPPKTKKRDEPNLRTILYSLGYDNKSMLVGSVRIRTPYSVPELMEHGGDIVDRQTGQVKHYAPRPYMGPSLEEEVRNPKLMQAWEDANR